jgi:hypothetical protein
MMPDTPPFPEFTPEQRQVMREKAARFFRPLHDDDDINRWRQASLEEKGQALAGLLKLVDAIGNYPPKRTRFPGFPRIIAEARARKRGAAETKSE